MIPVCNTFLSFFVTKAYKFILTLSKTRAPEIECHKIPSSQNIYVPVEKHTCFHLWEINGTILQAHRCCRLNALLHTTHQQYQRVCERKQFCAWRTVFSSNNPCRKRWQDEQIV